MTRTECALDLLPYLQWLPQPCEAIRVRYRTTSERTLRRHLTELRRVAGLHRDRRGRYEVAAHMFTDGQERRPR